MKTKWFSSGIFVLLFFFLSSCELVGGIFKAGMWTGILVVAAIIGLIIFLIGRMGKKG